MAVTLKDVAKEVNLSHATVSFVLNGRTDISILLRTRERVFQAAEALGYRPNLAARALVNGISKLIAVYLPDVPTSPNTPALARLQKFAQTSGYELVLRQRSSDTLTTTESRLQWPMDGMILLDCTAETLATLENAQTPTVYLGGRTIVAGDQVGIDLARAFELAWTRLIESGASSMAFVTQVSAALNTDPVEVAYRTWATRRGMEPQVIRARNTEMREAISSLAETGSFVCDGVASSLATLQAMPPRALNPGRIVGFSGDEGDFLVPNVSFISSPTNGMCRVAWQFLANRIANPGMERQISVFQPEMVQRNPGALVL